MTNAILTSGVALVACRYHCLQLLRREIVHAMLLAVSVALFGATHETAAEEMPLLPGVVTERSIKAAFVYKFLSYVDWPSTAFAQPDSPIVIGVIGADDIAGELSQIIEGRGVGSRRIVVRRLRDGESLAGVHVLFIGRSESARIGAMARVAQQRAILTIAEVPGAIEQGAIINFVVVDGKVRFDIAVDAAERASLKLSSRLLAVAQNVRTGS